MNTLQVTKTKMSVERISAMEMKGSGQGESKDGYGNGNEVDHRGIED